MPLNVPSKADSEHSVSGKKRPQLDRSVNNRSPGSRTKQAKEPRPHAKKNKSIIKSHGGWVALVVGEDLQVEQIIDLHG